MNDTIFDLNVYSEICCEECGNIIHNHIDCPICKSEYEETNTYGELESKDILQCNKCNTEFVLLSDSWYYKCKAKINNER